MDWPAGGPQANNTATLRPIKRRLRSALIPGQSYPRAAGSPAKSSPRSAVGILVLTSRSPLSWVARGGGGLRREQSGDDFRLGTWVNSQRQKRHKLSQRRKRRLESVPGWMWDSRDASWESGYERLLRFAQREGHCRVPSNYRDESGFRLDTWVAVQRRSRTRHELSRQRVRRLETVPGWLWEPKEMAWEDGYARLQAFVEREGHSRVPQPSRDDDGYALGTWVAAQRAFRRRGQLSDDRAQRLEAVSGWVWHVRDAKWEAAYARLHRFVEREGHSRVPDAYRDDDGYELGGWVRRQRDSRRRGVLSKDRARRLDALPGWVWEKKYEGAWDDGYARLQAFVHREGHSRVPGSYREDDGYALGVWVATQRNARKKGRLADVRARRLEALPRWAWDPYEADWREGLAALEEFVEREGHTHVPVAWRENGYRLGQWLRVQRREHGRGTLRPERRARLEALPAGPGRYARKAHMPSEQRSETARRRDPARTFAGV